MLDSLRQQIERGVVPEAGDLAAGLPVGRMPLKVASQVDNDAITE